MKSTLSEISALNGLPDHASETDDRQLPIDRVGIRGLRYPISVLDKNHQIQHTVADLGLFVGLPAQFKGTHMSRFVEVLNTVRGELTIRNLPSILAQIQRRLGAENAYLDAQFPYFIEKQAPVSKARSLMEYPCRFTASAREQETRFTLGVQVPVKSLCPCSKAISERGAHNQRSIVDVEIESAGFIWIEDVVEAVEACASAPVYALLKREDEKFVTEQAYDNPKFVEDLVRDVLIRLCKLEGSTRIRVSAENHESIHNHQAYAEIEWTVDQSEQREVAATETTDSETPGFSFGHWLRQQRSERKMNQAELATRLGITPSFLSRIESDDRVPSMEHLKSLALVLGVETEYVMLRAGVIPRDLVQRIQSDPELFRHFLSASPSAE